MMGNDVNEVNVRPKPCAVPRLTVCHHWEAKLMMIRVLSYDYSGLSLTDVIKCCGTSVQPLQSVNLFE